MKINQFAISLYSYVKQHLSRKDLNHYDQFVFQTRFVMLVVHFFIRLFIPIYNNNYPQSLWLAQIPVQILNVLIFFSKASRHIKALSCQATFLFPLTWLLFTDENVYALQMCTLGLTALFLVQSYPMFYNLLQMVLSFVIVWVSSFKTREIFNQDPVAMRLAYKAIFGWPPACLVIFSGIIAYNISTERIWKDYVLIKKEIQEKNKKLEEANSKMEEILLEREETNQRLEKTNRCLAEALKSQDLFVACVSHELRNPLNAMMGNIELLQQDEYLTENQKKMLKTSQVCGDILLVLINNILDVAKINADKLEINVSSIDMRSLIEKIWNVSRVRIAQKGLYGKLSISKNLPLWLKADSHRMMQIILNLMGNASKFTTKGGVKMLITWEETHVTPGSAGASTEGDVSTYRDSLTSLEDSDEGDFDEHKTSIPKEYSGLRGLPSFPRCGGNINLISELNNSNLVTFTENDSDLSGLKSDLKLKPSSQGILKIEVIDTGCGISSSSQQHLFQPFVQADASITRKYGGTGLGLYIIKQLVQKMNGTIELSSEIDKGTRFTLKIPMSTLTVDEAKQMQESSCIEANPLSAKEKTHRALIIDDSPFNQGILRTYLNNLHIEADTADNGLEGLNKIKSHPVGYYSLVTMDIQMPVMDGITATKYIRRYESEMKAKTPLPIIIITGNCSLNEQQECMDPMGEIRASYFFRKPFLYSDCKVCVEAILAQKNNCGQEKKKVLIVDDDAFNRELLKIQIGKLGLQCEECGSGLEALKKLKDKSKFGVVLMDFEMPGMNGIEATKKIRSELKIKDLFIVGTTGNVGEEMKKTSLESGMNKVLTKPISLNQISTLMKEYRLVKA